MRALVLALLLLHSSVTVAQRKILSMTGRVSWYGRQFAGRRMANGKRFNRNGLTAASRTLPIGTRLRLFCGKTGKSVSVTVTDRGPRQKRFMLDISEEAARRLEILRMGTAIVRVVPERPFTPAY